MKKLFFILVTFFFTLKVFSFSFKDDFERTISINKPKKVAVLQGSLASLWLLSGGKISAVTSDCLSGPPEMSKEKAISENEKWKTDGFFEHKAGIFEYLGVKTSKIQNVGTILNPNAELVIASGADFVLLSKNLAVHKKIESTLTAVGIKCAFFDYEDFSSYLRILELFCKINGNENNLEKFGKSQENEIKEIVEKAKKRTTKPKILLLRASPASVKAKSSDSLAIGKLLKELGTINIADSNKSFKENLSFEKIIIENPEYIFVDTMGANDEKSLEMIKNTLEENPIWKKLSAVQNGKYFILPKELFHFKPGKRWAESYRVLEQILER